jgi:hypothetical protein
MLVVAFVYTTVAFVIAIPVVVSWNNEKQISL